MSKEPTVLFEGKLNDFDRGWATDITLVVEQISDDQELIVQQIDDDLRAAFPGVDFELVPTNHWEKFTIQIEWCGIPPYTAVAAVMDKYKDVVDIILDCSPTPADMARIQAIVEAPGNAAALESIFGEPVKVVFGDPVEE